jgi:hypothetical protein
MQALLAKQRMIGQQPANGFMVDFEGCLGYKKSLHCFGRSLEMGSNGGFEQEKPFAALLELNRLIAIFKSWVNRSKIRC